jgi:hypothetical protein
MMINAETVRGNRVYGKNSATVNGRYYKENIGLMVSFILKPVMIAAKQ